MSIETNGLPPYLNRIEPMELEDIPLQVALLTMEIARLRMDVATLLDERRKSHGGRKRAE